MPQLAQPAATTRIHKIVEGLLTRKEARPRKLKTLTAFIKAQLNAHATDATVAEVISRLEKADMSAGPEGNFTWPSTTLGILGRPRPPALGLRSPGLRQRAAPFGFLSSHLREVPLRKDRFAPFPVRKGIGVQALNSQLPVLPVTNDPTPPSPGLHPGFTSLNMRTTDRTLMAWLSYEEVP